MTEEILAWHFTGDTLRVGRPIPSIGEWLVYDGDVRICKSGLHASERLIDALQLAPGSILHRVTVRGEIERQDDKLVGRERRIEWSINAEPTLRAFTRRVALDVAHLWDTPAIVREYLETGQEAIRSAAEAAARDAVMDAAGAAARDAARDAACAAAACAARGAVMDAAWAAAWAAASAAAWDKYNAWLTEMVEAARAQEI